LQKGCQYPIKTIFCKSVSRFSTFPCMGPSYRDKTRTHTIGSNLLPSVSYSGVEGWPCKSCFPFVFVSLKTPDGTTGSFPFSSTEETRSFPFLSKIRMKGERLFVKSVFSGRNIILRDFGPFGQICRNIFS